MIVIENYRARVLDNHLVCILRLMVTSEDSRTKLVNKAASCLPLAVAYTSSTVDPKGRVSVQLGALVPGLPSLSLCHTCQAVVEGLFRVEELRDVSVNILLHRQVTELFLICGQLPSTI